LVEATMTGQFKQLKAVRLRLAGGADVAVASDPERHSMFRRGRAMAPGKASPFPHRPDATVISESIPLFYIAQNKNGFWLAREANGRAGGLFLLKRSAEHFASANCRGAGCATIVLDGPFELDLPNKGGRLTALFDVAIDRTARRLPMLAMFIRMAAVECRKLIAEVSRALASERRHREAIEHELFGGQYTLSSKNDDDLPVIGRTPSG
jgi:hypothetical protein